MSNFEKDFVPFYKETALQYGDFGLWSGTSKHIGFFFFNNICCLYNFSCLDFLC
uniref:Endoplasmic reticulum-Golgi intermediate compartment protein n=1 Tax=Rhizophora mucronata TaxID=61149 RepID=A0A2P2LTL0_RHIMU